MREEGEGGGRVKGVFLILTVVHFSLDYNYVLYLCMSLLMWSDLSSMSVLNTNQNMRGKFSDNMQLPIGNEQICNNQSAADLVKYCCVKLVCTLSRYGNLLAELQ